VAAVALAVEEVVEPDLVERGRRGVRRQVAAEAVVAAVGPGDHGHGVPADEGPDAALHVLVAGEPRLLFGRDRVDVVGRHHGRHADLELPGPGQEAGQQETGAGPPPLVDHGVERVDPLPRLGGVNVGEMVRIPVDDHALKPTARLEEGARPLRRTPIRSAVVRTFALAVVVALSASACGGGHGQAASGPATTTSSTSTTLPDATT